MVKKRKKPWSEGAPPARKQPVAAPVPHAKSPYAAARFDTGHIAWHLRDVDLGGPFGWHTIGTAELEDLKTKLRDWEGMSLTEIRQQGNGRRNHSMPLDQICREAQKRLAELKLDDLGDEQLFSFRITGVRRVWGIMDRNICRLLWWDPDHQVYPMNIADN